MLRKKQVKLLHSANSYTVEDLSSQRAYMYSALFCIRIGRYCCRRKCTSSLAILISGLASLLGSQPRSVSAFCNGAPFYLKCYCDCLDFDKRFKEKQRKEFSPIGRGYNSQWKRSLSLCSGKRWAERVGVSCKIDSEAEKQRKTRENWQLVEFS